MQSALHDLTPTRTSNPRPFNICQRVLHHCHEILFGDPPEPSRNPYRSLPTSPHASSPSVGHIARPSSANPFTGREPSLPPDEPLKPPVRVNANVGAALVGMGLMAAGAPAMPQFTALAGEWAVIQGRRPLDDESASRARIEVDTSGGADGPRGGDEWNEKQKQTSTQESDSDDDESAASATDKVTKSDSKIDARPTPPQRSATAQPEALTSPTRPPLMNHVSTTAVNLLSQKEDERGRDPFMQNTSAPPLSSVFRKQGSHQPFHSVPDMSSGRQLVGGRSASRPPSAESLLAAYSLAAQRQLLKSHYTRSEIRFLLLLEDICNRLLVIPKPARISALRAELTSLNHNLPAEVCMPLWCNADHHRNDDSGPTGFLGKPKKQRRAHSRVVRISPGDSVVLNSAERAPYLLHVEILIDDLDFDPTKRENRELLKKIVVAEDLKRRKKEEGYDGHVPEGFGSAMPAPLSASALGGESATESPAHSRSQSHSRAETGDAVGTPIEELPEGPEEPEEMDLVEQLFGNKLSVRDNMVDLSESIPLPAAPKNKQLDLEVWNKDDQSRRSSLGSPGLPSPNGQLMPESTPRPITPVPLEPTISRNKPVITMEDYSERMRTAAVMLAQLNASLVPPNPEHGQGSTGVRKWIPGTGWITGSSKETTEPAGGSAGGKLRLAAAEAARIRERIMEEMMALEEERVSRMASIPEGVHVEQADGNQTVEDEGIVRREINKADPSAAVFKESWAAKKSRIRASSPWGHLANWDVISVIVKTGADLRQEQLATQLIERFTKIWKDEGCECWARFFRILITGETSGLVETVTDAVSVHSIKKSEYSRRVASGTPIGHVSLLDHFVNTYGKPDSGQFARARRNFIKSLAGYSVITYLLQIKDRHNGNILIDREGHIIHIDFGFMLSNSPGGNIGFEAAPFKLPMEYIDIMGGFDSPGFELFRKLFKQGFEAARKHSDSLITMVELMQKDSKLDCFVLFGENTVNHFRDRFCLGLTTAAVDQYLDRLIVSSAGSNYTRLYDTFQYYSQGVL